MTAATEPQHVSDRGLAAERAYAMYRAQCAVEGIVPESLEVIQTTPFAWEGPPPQPRRHGRRCPDHDWCDGPNDWSTSMCQPCADQRIGLMARAKQNAKPDMRGFEGHCEDCGTPVSRRNNGEYWARCLRCSDKKIARDPLL